MEVIWCSIQIHGLIQNKYYLFDYHCVLFAAPYWGLKCHKYPTQTPAVVLISLLAACC